MSFRSINHRYLAPGAQGLMIFGIISLCQPWSLFLHKYGVTLTLVGLVAFIVTSKIAPEEEVEEDLFDEAADVLELHGEHPEDVHEEGTYKDGGIV